MKKSFFFIAVCMMCCSCATLFNQPTIDVYINSTCDTLPFYLHNDSSKWYKTPVLVSVPRSKNDLLITIKKDSVEKLLQVNSLLSPSYYCCNIISPLYLGYLVDLSNQKRFSYPAMITIDYQKIQKKTQTSVEPKQDQVSVKTSFFTISTLDKPEKGQWNIKIGIPEGNHFYLRKENGFGNQFGFLGLSTGVEYYFSDKYCINTDVGAALDFMLPFPAAVDFRGKRSSTSVLYADLQIGSDYKRLHYDVGFNYCQTHFTQYDTTAIGSLAQRRASQQNYYSSDTMTYSHTSHNFGLAFSSYFTVLPHIMLGVNYYPSFVSWNNQSVQMHYTHVFLFEILFKIPAYRPREWKSLDD